MLQIVAVISSCTVCYGNKGCLVHNATVHQAVYKHSDTCSAGSPLLATMRAHHVVSITVGALLLSESAIAEQAPAIDDFHSDDLRMSFGTWFEGCASEGCGCGVPPELLVDSNGKPVPYVALNVQNTGIRDEKLERPLAADSEFLGMYANGQNCGRWIEIEFRANCEGFGSDAHIEPPSICGLNPHEEDLLQNFEEDEWTGALCLLCMRCMHCHSYSCLPLISVHRVAEGSGPKAK